MLVGHTIPGVPKEAERSIFFTLRFEKYSIFLFHQIKHRLLKRKIPRSLNWLRSFDSMVISKNIVTVNFLLIHSRDISVKDYGFSDFDTLLPGNPLIRANKTKKELIDCYTCRK